MELQRRRAVATRLLFPMVDTSGAIVTAASALDSESAFWDDASFTSGFLDCTNESSESSAFGWYKLLLTSDEMAHDYVAVKIDGDNANIIAQNILINTVMQSSDSFLTADEIASKVWGFSTRIHTSGALPADHASAVWGFSTRGITSNTTGLTASDVWVSSSRSLSASHLPNISSGIWAFSSRSLTSEVTASDVWASSSRILSNVVTGVVTSTPTVTSFDTDLAEATAGHYDDQVIWFISGNLTGQAAIISSYTGASGRVIVDEALTEAPASADQFILLPGQAISAAQTASAVWAHSTRSITSFSCETVSSDVWASSSRSLSDSFIANITSEVWAHSTRTLTSGGLPADNASAVWGFSTRGITSNSTGLTASDVWVSSSRSLSASFIPNITSAVWGFSTRGLTSLDDFGSAVWAFSSRSATSEELASDVWAHTLSCLSSVTAPTATPDAASALGFLFQGVRNQHISNDSFDFITDDGGLSVLQASLSDAGSTFVKGEYTTI